MKKAFAAIILVVVCWNALQKTLFFGFYELNKEYVVEKLCVNRDDANSDCKGKCFLMEEKNEKEAVGIIINTLKEIPEIISITETTKPTILAGQRFLHVTYLLNYHFLPIEQIDLPPEA